MNSYDAQMVLISVDVSAGETETVFTFGDFSKPVYPGETRLIGTSEGAAIFTTNRREKTPLRREEITSYWMKKEK